MGCGKQQARGEMETATVVQFAQRRCIGPHPIRPPGAFPNFRWGRDGAPGAVRTETDVCAWLDSARAPAGRPRRRSRNPLRKMQRCELRRILRILARSRRRAGRRREAQTPRKPGRRARSGSGRRRLGRRTGAHFACRPNALATAARAGPGLRRATRPGRRRDTGPRSAVGGRDEKATRAPAAPEARGLQQTVGRTSRRHSGAGSCADSSGSRPPASRRRASRRWPSGG